MREPTPRNSRLAIAASLAALGAVGGGGFLLGRGTLPQLRPAALDPRPAPAPSPTIIDTTPTPEVMNRADIIALGNAAADAAASGNRTAGSVPDPVGKRFGLLLPFGCNGPAPKDSNAPLRWNYDEVSSTLRVHVEPATWEPTTLWGDQVPAEVESLEGFWVAHPWSSRDTCPANEPVTAAPGIEAVTLPGQTLGLVEIFTAAASRHTQRRGTSYEAVMRVDRSALDLSQGLQLKVTGRIDRYPDGAPTRCIQPAGPEQRPICVVAVRLNEVSIVNPAMSEAISTWSVGQDVRSEP